MIFPRVKLADLLVSVSRPEPVEADREYRLLGARLYAGGLFAKDIKSGSKIQARVLYRVEEDDFVYNRLFAWKGSFATATATDHGGFVSNEFPCFRPRGELLDGRYLRLYFTREAAWNEALGLSSGSTPASRNRLKEHKLLAMTIPLPPLSEQQRIVARVEALAAKIEEARRLRREVTTATDVLARSAFQHKSGTRPEWPVVRLEEVCDDIIDTLHSNPVYCEDGVACVRSPDVGWGRIDLFGARRTSEDEYRRRTVRGEPRTSDIVFVREGGGTGRAAIVEDGLRFSLGQRVMLLRPCTALVLPLFLLHQLLSPLVYDDQVLPLIKGSASPHLNISTLRNFRIQLPPLAEQDQIVAYLEDLKVMVGSLKRLQDETEMELDALLPSILDQAFSGCL